MWKENVTLASSFFFSPGMVFFGIMWEQGAKYATGKVSLGFKELTKWGSITGVGDRPVWWDVKIQYVDIPKEVEVKFGEVGLAVSYVFTIRYVRFPVTPLGFTVQMQSAKQTLNSIMLVINLCLYGNVISQLHTLWTQCSIQPFVWTIRLNRIPCQHKLLIHIRFISHQLIRDILQTNVFFSNSLAVFYFYEKSESSSASAFV